MSQMELPWSLPIALLQGLSWSYQLSFKDGQGFMHKYCRILSTASYFPQHIFFDIWKWLNQALKWRLLEQKVTQWNSEWGKNLSSWISALVCWWLCFMIWRPPMPFLLPLVVEWLLLQTGILPAGTPGLVWLACFLLCPHVPPSLSEFVQRCAFSETPLMVGSNKPSTDAFRDGS